MGSLFKAQYYKKPEGQDAMGKILATNRYALCTGLAVSTIDVLMISHPKGYGPTLARYLYFTGPLMGMASAFTLGTFLSTRIREKDDKINYIVGSCAAAGVFGAWRRNVVAGLTMCAVFSIAGCVKKMSKEQGWEFFPEDAPKYHGYGSLRGVTHDYTLMKDTEKGWTKGN